VHPGIREHLFGTSEFTQNWEDQYKSIYKNYFPNLDISHILTHDNKIDELFYLRGLPEEIQERIKGKTQVEANDIFKESIRARFPRSGEVLEGTYDRVFAFRNQIEQHLAQRPKKDQHKKILVVSHSVLLKFWTGTWEGAERPYASLPDDWVQVRN
jgi:broad specificity phosphatase PhoE